jgi:osmotically-inducible protein OsmY
MYESVRLGRTLVLLAGAGLCVVALAAANPPPAGNLNDAYRDLQLTVHVRRALREDDNLVSVNVGVRVRDGVAILWGPVPSAEVVTKALARVEKVQGILGVRNETYIALPDRNLEPIPIPLVPPDPQRSASASPDPASGSLNSLTTTAREGPDDGAASDPPPAAGRRAIPSTSPEAPTAEHTPRARPVSRPAPAPAESLSAAVATLRTGETRFRTLRVEVKGGTVVVAGAAERQEDVMALARLISRLPGVERVVTKTADGAP